LDPKGEIYALATAYLQGVNQFIEHGPTPVEFLLVGVEKEPYELVDIYNILGYMSFSFAMAHKTDPLLSLLHDKLDSSYLVDLQVDVNPGTTLIHNFKNHEDELLKLVSDVNEIMATSPVPPFVGSNSWVAGPQKTQSGKVLFANDPHIKYGQPGSWYEAHIKTPDYEMYGYHLAGVPIPLLGHNRTIAYGLTMFENDDIDFYAEEVNPDNPAQYKTNQGFVPFTVEEKTILVKDEEPVTFVLRKTNHGPIVNDVVDQITQSAPIAMSWIYTQFNVEILEALQTISNANSIADARHGASLIHAPGLNVMYGDADGNIGWWAAGKLYLQKPDVNRKFILNGAGDDDPVRYLNFEENPQAENPDWDYVYSANNQPDSIAGVLYPGYYLPEDRAKRIVQLLESKNDWTLESFGKMINDVTSPVALKNVKSFSRTFDYNGFSKTEQQVIDVLQLWDGSNTSDQIAPTIYNKWIYLFLKLTFEDEMGPDIFKQLVNTHLMKRVINDHLNKENSVWWDDISTPDVKESKSDILAMALKETVAQLQDQFGNSITTWNWGKVHTLEHKHSLGSVRFLRSFFNVGPFPMKGAREVIDNRGYKYNDLGIYDITAGPSTRRIIDFSDVENSKSILPTGQSGNPLSLYYKDQAEIYNKGEFRKMKMNTAEIKSVSTQLNIVPRDE
jgi:penicillin amidase